MARRFLIVLTTALIVSTSAYAEGDVDSGKVAYKVNCASCHRDAATLADGITDEDLSKVDAFFKRHFAKDDTDRANIIAYLLSLDAD